MNFVIRTFVIILATMVTVSAYAQMPDQGQRPQRQHFSVENMVKMQTEQTAQMLKLTEEQAQELYQLNLANANAQIKQMEEMRKRQQTREAAYDEAIKLILDESQYKKWAKHKQQQQQNRMNRGMGGPGMMGPRGMNGGFGGETGGFGNSEGFGGGGFDNEMGF